VVDTYYVPSGHEHLIQTANEEAEAVVLERALSGHHVHTWSKDTGIMCVSGLETRTSDEGVSYKAPIIEKIERGTKCKLGNKEMFE